jgi:hypothetical protein
VKPTSPATFGVAITSPEPTMEAVIIRPGPMLRRMAAQWRGADCVAGVAELICGGSERTLELVQTLFLPGSAEK